MTTDRYSTRVKVGFLIAQLLPPLLSLLVASAGLQGASRMFPVPDHLPRSTGDHLSSGTQAGLAPGPADPVLELLNPLLAQAGPSKPARWSVAQVRKVREDLESAVNANKVRSRSSAVRTLFTAQVKTHQLVTSNFPAISTQIRLGKEIQEQSGSVVDAIQRLEKSLDPSDPEVGRTGHCLTGS